MQNRFFGDIGDFGKYFLLRQIQQNTTLRIGINWYLNYEDADGCGESESMVSYLKNPNWEFKSADSELYVLLQELVIKEKIRNINQVRKKEILKKISEFDMRVPRDRKKREKWFNESLEVFRRDECDVLFLDPDNQIEITSEPYSTKHIRYDEISNYWKEGLSLILYNHRDRTTRKAYLKKLFDLNSTVKNGPSATVILEYPYGTQRHYVFLLKEKHRQDLKCLFDHDSDLFHNGLFTCL